MRTTLNSRMWKPISLADLNATIRNDLEDCTPELRALYERAAIEPEKWTRPPWGEGGGGFWAIAVLTNRVLWFNDIEEGFNVSPFSLWGEIGDYVCNQDPLRWALPRLVGDLGTRMGAPQTISRL
jgi:hypothetical protein